MKKITPVMVPFIVTGLAWCVLDYMFLPAYNVHFEGFWLFLMLLAGIFLACLVVAQLVNVKQTWKRIKARLTGKAEQRGAAGHLMRILACIIVISAAALLVGGIFSARLFHAKAYSQLIKVEDGNEEDIPTVSKTAAIALMDTSSARKLASREMGSLTELVSQFEVSEDIYTVNVAEAPVKLATLDYAGFFKWLQNREGGIPGYISVSPTKMDADYVKLDQGMRYTRSAWFADNLERRIRFRYRTALTGTPHFEINEEGKPYYVTTVYQNTIGLFGGTTPAGCIVTDPCTGAMEKYALSDVPGWIDMVYTGDIITSQYNDSAQLMSGFINSVIGQKGCRKITENEGGADFGYIAKEGDIYYYTGVTSVNNDSSNLGFLFVNERTGKAEFIECPGADEFSAMNAAEGEVQEKGYRASFPSLINIEGKLTYICVLKDKSGLVKMYACIDAEQYNKVAVASAQKECIAKFEALQRGEISQEEAVGEGTVSEDSGEKAEEEIDTSAFEQRRIKIKKLESIVISGDTYLYVVDGNDQIYHAKYEDVIGMLLLSEGDETDIYTDGEHFLLDAPEEASPSEDASEPGEQDSDESSSNADQ